MSGADTRGFTYTLQAPMARRQWAIDRLQTEMTAARGDQLRLATEYGNTSRTCETEAERVQSNWLASADPGARQGMLEYLARLRDHQVSLQRRIDAVDGQVGQLEQALTEAQARLSMLEQHREEQRADFARVQQRAADSEADAQWLALARWRGSVAEGGAA